MSVVAYFGSGPGDLRVMASDLSRAVSEVSNGGPTGKGAQEQVLLSEQGYACVGDYDPVLRAHCRLDRQG